MTRVLLVAWSGAAWKPIRKLLDTGRMPQFAALLKHGAHGNLATLQPQSDYP